MINSQNKHEECFKWAVIAALHHEEFKTDHQVISRLRPYENQYNWKGLEFPVLRRLRRLISSKKRNLA